MTHGDKGRGARISDADFSERQNAEAVRFEAVRNIQACLKRLQAFGLRHGGFVQTVARRAADAFCDERPVGWGRGLEPRIDKENIRARGACGDGGPGPAIEDHLSDERRNLGRVGRYALGGKAVVACENEKGGPSEFGLQRLRDEAGMHAKRLDAAERSLRFRLCVDRREETRLESAIKRGDKSDGFGIIHETPEAGGNDERTRPQGSGASQSADFSAAAYCALLFIAAGAGLQKLVPIGGRAGGHREHDRRLWPFMVPGICHRGSCRARNGAVRERRSTREQPPPRL